MQGSIHLHLLTDDAVTTYNAINKKLTIDCSKIVLSWSKSVPYVNGHFAYIRILVFSIVFRRHFKATFHYFHLKQNSYCYSN